MRYRTLAAALLGLAFAACSGGGSSTVVSTPTEPWAKFRHDLGNSGAGGGAIYDNDGTRHQFPPAGQPGLDPISASPAIGYDHTRYFATEGGELYALNQDMTLKWGPFKECALNGKESVPIGPVLSSPAVTAVASQYAASVLYDKVIYFGDTNGHLFAVQDKGDTAVCQWTFPPPPDMGDTQPQPALPAIVSSPTFLLDSVEGLVTGIYFGTTGGVFYALNGDGSLKWQYPPAGQPPLPPITASPAVDIGGPIYFPAADGNLYELSLSGALLSPFPLPIGTVSDTFASSPARGTNLYVGTEDGKVVAKDALGNPRWTFVVPNHEPVVASVALAVSSLPAPTPTAGPSPPITPGSATPTPSPTPSLELRPLVLALARDGMLYPLDDNNNGEIAPGIEQPAGGGPSVSSPAVSSDGCIVFADDDGNIHIRQLQSSLPSTGPTPTPTSTTECTSKDIEGSARIPGSDVGMPIRSSPVIDTDGVIVFGADDGYLYAIGTPH